MTLPRKTINILGATGSIGQSTADVILSAPDKFDVNVITAHHNEGLLLELAEKLGANAAILTSKSPEALYEALTVDVDITVAAIMGMAGLKPLMIAIEHSKSVAIANKEPLVAAGPQVLAAAEKHGTTLLPLDSEHNAIFQVFDSENPDGIEKIILTGSGGPFRTWDQEQIQNATPAQALKHPNWSMGKKITIDSATMMNKGLEVIEAHYLFNMVPDKIDVVIHPQSVIHSMVEYKDGSILAQMGASDMRTPIAHALAWPERMRTPGDRLDLAQLSRLDFETPDYERFPSLPLSYQCLKQGQASCIVLNAANEIAVEAFLDNKIGFIDIMRCISDTLDLVNGSSILTLNDVEMLDYEARSRAQELILNTNSKKITVG